VTIDFNAVSAAIRDVAAEEIVPRFQNLKPDEVDTKSGKHDLVTAADQASEAALSARLKEITPDFAILGEEMAFDVPDAVRVLEGDRPVWVLDPVDGTHNFVHGNSRFGVILALVHRRKIEAGWLYAPVDDVMFAGAAGGGVTRNGAPLTLPQEPPLSLAEVRIDSPSRLVRTASADFAKVVSSRSSCWAYIDVLNGDIDVSISNPIYPWDHAAGVFLVNEAGGQATLITGERYDPAHELKPGERKVDGPPRLIAAVNDAHWVAVTDKLKALEKCG